MKERYDRAWALMPERAAEKASNILFTPVFAPDGDFACKVEYFEGDEKKWRFLRFGALSGEQSELFDHAALAAQLAEKSGDAVNPHALALTLDELYADGCAFWLGAKRYTLKRGELAEDKYAKHSVSPDGKRAVFIRGHDLWMADTETGAEKRLTYDGKPHYDYASRPEGDTYFIADKLAGTDTPPGVLWSPGGRYFVTYKLDQRKVRELHLIQSVPSGPDIRPRLHAYKYAMPGDEHVPESTLYLCDTETLDIYPVRTPPTHSSTMPAIGKIASLAAWSDTGRTLVTYHMSRDFKTASVYLVSPRDGSAETLFEETTDTFHFFDFFSIFQNENAECKARCPAPMWYLDGRRELIWLSQQDGRWQLYGYGADGARRRITHGDFDVCRIAHIGQDRLYLSVFGLGENPYDCSLVSVPLEGGEAEVILNGGGSRLVTFSPTGERFVAVTTGSDLPPVSGLYNTHGEPVCELARCDAAQLEAAGLIWPRRFCLKGADGETDIYGILLLPEENCGEKLPLVDYYYGGNQTAVVPHTFYSLLNTGFIESIAQLGCAVVVIDGMGTPLRGKHFHDACHKNVGDCAGLEDHVAVINRLCELYPQLDRSRVGVWGHSGGGFAAFHCMTKHPELYRCGISSGGNHTQEIYISDWSERFMGEFDAALWHAQRAENLAHRLEGALLLIHGELDDNVHPAHTMRVVDALIKADKDFELLIMPGLHHALRPSNYFRRRILDFFARQLL